MGDPKKTGISGITGKVLYIRHASDSERSDVEALARKQGIAANDLAAAEIVVASLEGRILGFALLTKRDGCMKLFEQKRHRGIGQKLVGHLIGVGAREKVVADREIGRYLSELGYQRQGAAKGAERRSCGNLSNRSAFRYVQA